MSKPSGRLRRFVTVVRSDVEGSTRLGERHDPELVRQVLARYYDAARSAIQRHGGTIEQFQGDAVVALFGLPQLHEDDALRAVRAARELCDRMGRLNDELKRTLGLQLPIRTAVHSGEVVAGSSAPGQLTGDVMNVVAHMEKLAQPGEIILGDTTLRLVGEAVDVEEVGPLMVKGRHGRVLAHRLLPVLPGSIRRAHPPIPLVGRDRELRMLTAAYARTLSSRSCHLVTLFGEAGVGKSRLVEELLQTVGEEATVLRTSCRSYDVGAYDAIIHIITEAAGLDLARPEDAASRLASLIGDAEGAARITERIGQILGVRKGVGPPEDIHWALRRFLEILAQPRPLVVVLDDLHWAEPALLDLIEAIAASTRDAPLLLVCTARRELTERRSKWAGGALNVVSLQLARLRAEEVGELVAHLLGGGDIAASVQEFVADRSDGNPLFVQGLVAVLRENDKLRLDEGQWRVTGDLDQVQAPPDIRALLGARLDHLGSAERDVIERAAVIGRQFTAGAIRELSPRSKAVALVQSLRVLVDKELIVHLESAADEAARDQAYAFTHILIQEVAYLAISKETRAELHERYAKWLERAGGSLEDVGYHLERAYRSLDEIGRRDEQAAQLARRAGETLAAAGRRAVARRDTPETTISLLRRAVSLLNDNDRTRRVARLDLANALSNATRYKAALKAYSEAIEEAVEAGDRQHEAHGRLGVLSVKHFSGRESITLYEETIEEALQTFERYDDKPGLATTWRLTAYVRWAAGRLGRAEASSWQAVELARQSGDEPLEARSFSTHCFILFWGPRHADEVAQRVRQALEWARSRGVRSLEVDALRILARIEAMQGRFAEARELLRQTGDAWGGDALVLVGGYVSAGLVELLADQPAEAERALREGYRSLEDMGGQGQLVHVTTLLARALERQGRHRDAMDMTVECEDLATARQLGAQVAWRSIRAVALARMGEHEAAERLARQAVDLTSDWDQDDSTAETLADYADVLRRIGRDEEALLQARRALELYQAKGNLVGRDRMLRFVQAGAA
jgi:class 3 adenylate cyclase/tetratricopeptide (TPR) repeat protein